MSTFSLTPEAESLICTELQKAFPNVLSIEQSKLTKSMRLDLFTESKILPVFIFKTAFAK